MPSNPNLNIFLHAISDHKYEIVDWGDYRIGYFLAKNKEKSVTNEDTLFVITNDDGIVFGVSDGAGGHPKGSEAAFLTGEIIQQYFQKNSIKDANMTGLIEQINDNIIDTKVGARCTLLFGSISQDLLRSYSIGDSEIIYWNSSGNEIYSNIPHSEVGYQIEAGVLKQKESLDAPDRYIVNNMLGDTSIRIEVASKMNIKKGVYFFRLALAFLFLAAFCSRRSSSSAAFSFFNMNRYLR